MTQGFVTPYSESSTSVNILADSTVQLGREAPKPCQTQFVQEALTITHALKLKTTMLQKHDGLRSEPGDCPREVRMQGQQVAGRTRKLDHWSAKPGELSNAGRYSTRSKESKVQLAAGSFVSPSRGRLAAWPPGRLAAWPPGRLAAWPPGRLAAWPPGRLAAWPPGRLAAWPPGLFKAIGTLPWSLAAGGCCHEGIHAGRRPWIHARNERLHMQPRC